jgi:hypothetical protein
MGIHAAARKAKTEHAQCAPSVSYMPGVMSGNAMAKTERRTTVEAIALAL